MSGVELELVACFPGTRRLERALHQRFTGCRRHGEWFEPNAAMTAWLERARWGKP